MISLEDIRPVSDFQRHTKACVARLKKTGRPEVLTINGRAEVVVQDAAAYQQLMDRLDAIEGIRRGLESAARGEGIPLDQFERQIRARHGLGRRS